MNVQGYWAEQRAPVFRNLPANLVAGSSGRCHRAARTASAGFGRSDLVDATVTRCLPISPLTRTSCSCQRLASPRVESMTAIPAHSACQPTRFSRRCRDIGSSVARAGVERLFFLKRAWRQCRGPRHRGARPANLA